MDEDSAGVVDDPLEGDLNLRQMRELSRHSSILAFRKHAVLQVVSGKGDAFDFKIIDRQVERQKDGKLLKRAITEIWSWSSGEQRYAKR